MKKKNKKLLNKNVNIMAILCTYTIFAVIFILVVSATGGNNVDIHDLFDNNSYKISDSLKDIVYKQNASNKKIKNAAVNSSYTLDNPYILKNPYDLNPLSAIIAFTTPMETTVEVTLNDNLLGTTEKTTSHIIPIYGLYSETYNNVQLKLEDETVGNIIIKTNELEVSNDTVVNDNFDNNVFTFVSNGQNIKSYDYMNNIRFLIDGLKDINSFTIKDDLIYVNCYTNNTNNGLYLTIDLLGHIKSIDPSLNDYNGSNNIRYNIFENQINNYSINNYNDKTEYTKGKMIDLSEISKNLLIAPLYKEKFEASYNNEYLTYKLNEKGFIIAIRSDGKAYSYKINDDKYIRLDDNYDYALYLNVDSAYYNLYTIIKNN